MRGDSPEYNAILARQNCMRWADNDKDRALVIACEALAEFFGGTSSGFARYGGPKDGTPRHKARYAPPLLVDGEE